MLSRPLLTALLLLGLSACATLPPAAPPPAPVASAAPAVVAPPGFPANLRADLVPKWIQFADNQATISWPPNNGCDADPVAQTLPVGTELDRFGTEGGTFFSPRGESYASRAVPYVCEQMDYRVYKVVQPIAVKTCKAAPWFGAPGGAVQDQTADPAYKLVAAGSLEPEVFVHGGSGGAMPQCAP